MTLLCWQQTNSFTIVVSVENNKEVTEHQWTAIYLLSLWQPTFSISRAQSLPQHYTDNQRKKKGQAQKRETWRELRDRGEKTKFINKFRKKVKNPCNPSCLRVRVRVSKPYENIGAMHIHAALNTVWHHPSILSLLHLHSIEQWKCASAHGNSDRNLSLVPNVWKKNKYNFLKLFPHSSLFILLFQICSSRP